MAIQRWCTRIFLLGGLLLVASSGAQAFERYNDGCNGCHGEFTSTDTTKTGNTWPDDKHDVHRKVMLDEFGTASNPPSCVFCHIISGGEENSNPLLGESDGDATFGIPGAGCAGCHGQPTELAPGLFFNLGTGLRAHHAANGVTSCGEAFCHDSDPAPLPESALPVYYGLPGVNITDPCLDKGFAGSEANYTSDTIGNDNDGDGDYESADSDCVSGTPDVQLAPPTLGFASVAIADSKGLTTQVQNMGTVDLNVSSPSLCAGTSGEFSWSPTAPFTVTPGNNQLLTVTYAPVDAGPDSGCISIPSNDPDENPIELAVSGEGVICLADLMFTNTTINQAEEIVACISITLGANTLVTMGNFRAGELFEFRGPVEATEMTLTLDESLLPPP